MNSDIRTDWGVIRLLPESMRPYALLMRLDRPIGTWLLLLPSWWSLTAAMAGAPTAVSFGRWLWLMGLFAVGAVVLRGAGCTINDILDRDLDAQVERTAHRPLACGAVSVRQAVIFLAAQLLVGLLVLVQLNKQTVVMGCCALLLVGVYPMMKRLTYWPQAWLGITFNWGALLGWVAVTQSLAAPPLVVYLAGIAWTLGYDTIYAHQDKADDVTVGVKSTALALGGRTVPFLWAMYGVTVGLLVVAGVQLSLAWGYYVLIAVAAAQMAWQALTVDIDCPADCLQKFRSNREAGLLVAAAFGVGVWG